MKDLLKFIRKYNEFITIPIGLALWYWSIPFLRWLDPTSAVFDGGIFQIIIYAIIAFLILKGVAWLALRLAFPSVYRYLDNEMEWDFKNLSKIQKICVSLGLLLLFFFALIVSMFAL